MDAKTMKLARKIGDAKLARALVQAGIDNPAKLRKASDALLDKAIGKAARKALRG